MASRLSVAFVAVVCATSSVAEQPRTTVGLLTCTLAGTQGADNISCGLKATRGESLEEKYVGIAHGLAIPSVGKQVLVWTVTAPTSTKVSAGFLAQSYARAKEGGYPPSWIGERNPEIALQIQSHEGAELGNGIERLDLKVAGTSA